MVKWKKQSAMYLSPLHRTNDTVELLIDFIIFFVPYRVTS